MSHLNQGLLGTYNSLTDKHLTGYFNNARIRRHLQKVGLLSRSGRIIPEKEYRHKLIQRTHQRHVRECLAQAIFHKVLDMERLHQIEIKRKLEEFARRERVHKSKVERTNRYEEDPIMILSPRPPTGPKNSHARHSGPEGEHSESTESPGSSRPNTAPGKMQRPVRLKPLNRTSTPGSMKRNSSRYRHHESSNETDHPFSSPLETDATRHLTLTDFSSIVSPYRLPVINNFVTPVPPLTKRKEKGPKVNGTLRGRRLRPTTAPSAADTQEGTIQRMSAQSGVSVKMVYFGKSVHLSHDLMGFTDEVKVFQQHCGGENLCVYKGQLKEGETFQFVSRRHRGFPFSLTFFLNGLQVERLSSCCEFKHRKGSRLGGRNGHFGFVGVEAATPCYRCIIAMGLDKIPTPPKRVKEDPLLSTSLEEEVEEEDKPDPIKSLETQTDAKEDENKPKNDYEEDFEADDEGPVEDGAEERNETPSLTREEEEETGNKDENKNEVTEQSQDSDSEAEDSDKNKIKRSSSISSGLSSSSSSSEEDQNDGGPEPGDGENIPEENLEPVRCDSVLTSEKDTKMEETEAMDTSSVSLPQQTEEESQTQDGFIEKSEVEISEDTERDDGEKLGDGAAEDQAKDQENVVEPEKAKSVQEKVAEAILNMAECSSEPELSDTTTEEDEVASVKTMQDSPGAVPESVAAPQLAGNQDNIYKENVAGEEDVDKQKPSEELEGEPCETPQLESKTQEEENNTEASKDTGIRQEDEKEEQPVGEEQKDSAIAGEDETEDISSKIGGNEQVEEDEVPKEDNTSIEPEVEEKPDNDETAEAMDSLVQDAEKETKSESENTTNVKENPGEEPETGEEIASSGAIVEPQSEDPGETAVVDTETVEDADYNVSRYAETVSEEQTEKDTVNAENGGEKTREEASPEEVKEEEIKEEVSTDERETDGQVYGEESNNADELRTEVTEDIAEAEEDNMAEDEEISDEVEAGENNLEVFEEENKSEEIQDDGKTDNHSKEPNDDKPEEELKENDSVQEDETEKTEKESADKAEEDDGLTELAEEKDVDAEESVDKAEEDGGQRETAEEKDVEAEEIVDKAEEDDGQKETAEEKDVEAEESVDKAEEDDGQKECAEEKDVEAEESVDKAEEDNGQIETAEEKDAEAEESVDKAEEDNGQIETAEEKDAEAEESVDKAEEDNGQIETAEEKDVEEEESVDKAEEDDGQIETAEEKDAEVEESLDKAEEDNGQIETAEEKDVEAEESVDKAEDDNGQIETAEEKDAEAEESVDKAEDNNGQIETAEEKDAEAEESVDKAEEEGEQRETVEEKSVEAEDESKSDNDNKPDIRVEENESVKEDEAKEAGQPEKETESVDQVEEVADENNQNDEAEEDDGGGNEAEVKEGLEETEEGQAPQTEEVDHGKDEKNTEEGNEDEEIIKEEKTVDSANPDIADEEIPASGSNLEVNETENKPGKTDAEDKLQEPEHEAREAESTAEKNSEQEGGCKSGNDNTLVEEIKDNDSVKENALVLSEDNAQKENSECNVNDGQQEATAGADGEIGKEKAKSDEDEKTFEEAKEEIDQTETEQAAKEDDTKDEQEDGDKEKEEVEKVETVSPKASSNGDVQAEVPSDAIAIVEEPGDSESEGKGTDTVFENKAKDANIARDDNQKCDAIEDASANGEGSISSPSPSEESQPAEKVMALKREERESTFSEDTELIVTPPTDLGDLVSNWVNIHRNSRYFETFVEPLDDMKSLTSHEGEGRVNGEAVDEVEGIMQDTKDSESVGVDKTSETAINQQLDNPLESTLQEDLEDTPVESFRMETEVLESDARSNQSKDTTPGSAKNESEDRGDTEAKDLASTSETQFTAAGLQEVTVDNVISLLEMPAMTSEISQES